MKYVGASVSGLLFVFSACGSESLPPVFGGVHLEGGGIPIAGAFADVGFNVGELPDDPAVGTCTPYLVGAGRFVYAGRLALRVGDLTFEDLSNDNDPALYDQPQISPPLEPGTVVEVETEGSSEVPAFALQVEFPQLTRFLNVPDDYSTVPLATATHVEWEASAADGGRVHLLFDQGTLAIYCVADATLGQFTIPSEHQEMMMGKGYLLAHYRRCETRVADLDPRYSISLRACHGVTSGFYVE